MLPPTHIRYSAFCDQMHVDSILTVSMFKHSLESTAPCPNELMCVDFVEMELPYGDTCTTCGDLPLKCRQNDQYELPSQLYFDGIHKLRLKFRTNRQENNPLHGFQFLTLCVEKSYFFSDNCTTPSATPGRKRRNGDSLLGVNYYIILYVHNELWVCLLRYIANDITACSSIAKRLMTL